MSPLTAIARGKGDVLIGADAGSYVWLAAIVRRAIFVSAPVACGARGGKGQRL